MLSISPVMCDMTVQLVFSTSPVMCNVQVRAVQAQLADARQELQDQAAEAQALQSRLDAANKTASQKAQEHSSLQVPHLMLQHVFLHVLPVKCPPLPNPLASELCSSPKACLSACTKIPRPLGVSNVTYLHFHVH